MDRRLTPANGRVAALHLQGQVTAEAFVAGEPAQVIVPVADIWKSPEGARDRQVLFGARVMVYERRAGFAFVQSERDGYCGYISETALGAATTPNHRVAVTATHIYREPNIKTGEVMHLSLGAEVTVLHELEKFFETPEGFIWKSHLRPLDRPFNDPVTVAQMLFGVPYLWGGNSALGIDCSGTVSMAMACCNLPCAGDADLQEATLGEHLPADAALERGDVIFWKGHVALVVDPETILHANGHHMAVRYEGLAAACARIEAQGGGPVTARKRLIRAASA